MATQAQTPNFQLIVKVRDGLIIRDRPAPQSRGAQAMRSIGVGKSLLAHEIIQFGDVPYARLIAQDPLKPEWVRVREADGSIEYVEVFDLRDGRDEDVDSDLVHAIRELAAAIRGMK